MYGILTYMSFENRAQLGTYSMAPAKLKYNPNMYVRQWLEMDMKFLPIVPNEVLPYPYIDWFDIIWVYPNKGIASGKVRFLAWDWGLSSKNQTLFGEKPHGVAEKSYPIAHSLPRCDEVPILLVRVPVLVHVIWILLVRPHHISIATLGLKFFLLTSCCNPLPLDSWQVFYESHGGSRISWFALKEC